MLVFQLVAGLLLLVGGAELLVRGASAIALRLGVSSLIVSLTLVSIGTSAPEVFVTVQAGVTGRTDLALGNVIGSNVANVGLVIGICGLFRALTAGRRLLRFDLPVVVFMTVLVGVLGYWDGGLSTFDGALLFALFLAYMARTVRTGLLQAQAHGQAMPGQRRGLRGADWLLYGAMFAGGLAGLVLGSRWLVDGASAFALRFGMPESLVGSTIVAIGTSLPEVATSLVATLRNDLGVAIGNAVGSCIANLGLVLGAGCLAAGSMAVPEHLIRNEITVAVLLSVILLLFLTTQGKVIRAEAWMLLLGYITYFVLVTQTGTASPLPIVPALLVAYAVLLALVVRTGLPSPGRRSP
ncbi:MAG: sodium:calcium antiporter [Gemmatimonadota bacterium]|nr:MAG: sodium:calcium antiporter [Gemmatimonadota bacterium]